MLRDDRRLKAGRESGVETRAFLDRLLAWRSLTTEAQQLRISGGDDDFEASTEPDLGRVRVGFWSPCLGLGGAEVWQLALARSVDPSRIVWKGAAVIEGRGASDPRMIRELGAMMPVGHGSNAARALAAESDLIVTWAVTNIDGLLQGLTDPPVVVMACHFPGESPWGPGTEDLLRSVARFVAVSELAVESTPLSVRDRVAVIWNAIDPRRLEIRRDRATIRASWRVPPDAPVVGFLGRLSFEKDPDAMLRMAAHLPEPWHVVIVGEGREQDALRRKIASEHLTRVRLVGGDPSAGDVLNGFDRLAVPSVYESFGLSLAEGLWAGVPVVSTRSGLARLIPGLVREVSVGASGREWSEAILADFAEVEATRRRVAQARDFVKDRLTLDRFGNAWTDLMVDLARNKKGARP